MGKRLCIIVGIAILSMNADLFAGGGGTTSASFLRLGIGARNAAMGETGAGERSANSLYWNPAGLASLPNGSVSFMYAQWLADVAFQNVSYATRVYHSVVGLSATYLSMPSIDRYDNTGLRTSGSFSPSDLAVGLSYAHALGKVSLGGTLKYISSQLDTLSAQAVAADVGMTANPYVPFLKKNILVGAVVQNIGTAMKFNRESFSLPLNVKAGAVYAPAGRWLLALDLNKPLGSDVIVNAGTEYAFAVGPASLAPRIGYRSDVKAFDGLYGLTAGIGFGYGNVGVDYAFVPYGSLDTTHRVSLTFSFK